MKVAFFITPSFFRTANRTNPYFDPIIEVCTANGIEWDVWIPHSRVKHGYPPDRVRSYRALDRGSVWFWRVVHCLWRAPAWKINLTFGRLVRKLHLPLFRDEYEVVITSAGLLADVLGGLLPHRRVVDVQHGVIYSGHQGYFDGKGLLLELHRKLRNREYWVYGPGFADCFFRNPDNRQYLGDRVKVLGAVHGAVQPTALTARIRKTVAIAAQFTRDFSPTTLAQMKKLYEDFLDANVELRDEVKFIFRQHPRYYGCIDLSDWRDRYPWLVMDDKRPWGDVFAEAVAIVTIHSTSAFDAAAYGVPTVFLDETRLGWPNVMKGDLGYPCPDLTLKGMLTMDEDGRRNIDAAVLKWYNDYYKPFSAANCLALLKKEC